MVRTLVTAVTLGLCWFLSLESLWHPSSVKSVTIASILVLISFTRGDAAAEQCSGDAGACAEEKAQENEDDVFDVFGKWVDDMKVQGSKFLNENVLAPLAELGKEGSKADLDAHTEDKTEGDEAPSNGFSGLAKLLTDLVSTDASEGALETLIESARSFTDARDTKEAQSFQEIFQVFSESLGAAKAALDRHFGDLNLDKFSLVSLFYYLEAEDERKHPSWKRRMHRFHKGIDSKKIAYLHRLLYLSDLSYMDTVDEIRTGLEKFKDSYELIYCKIDSGPAEPAHFVALKKERQQSLWDADSLDVLIVVRGTKEWGDFISDTVLDAEDYRGGKTHAGVAASGKYIADKHMDLLDNLLEMSGKSKIKLTLTGHSLGAGAASIAAIEFNDHEKVDVQAIGFGCPALLSKELSESTKSYITTVINDSDVVPRMSGATVSNAILDIMSFDYTDMVVRDVGMLFDVLKAAVPFIPQSSLDGALDHLKKHLGDVVKPELDAVIKERVKQVLIPPGTCIHLFRDGIAVSGTYTPCDFFNEVDISRTMLDDHYTLPGYHRLFLELARMNQKDLHFKFEHDIVDH